MKINDSKKNTSLPLGQTQANAGKRVDKAGTEATPPADTLKPSPMSAQLQSLQGTMAASNVFDANKVEAIKLAIADGKFQVDAEKVADGLITTVKNLLQARRN
ncbi:MAG TPA: flagellar biosynthesis anti-sigma factor FlgM [Sulfuriferula sp.]|nr:flagellar biosynthesis anti-sigma factor FlgM [Sulfuriferula sp.]